MKWNNNKRRVMGYVLNCWRNGFIPSGDEIAEHFDFSRSWAFVLINGLVSDKLLERRDRGGLKITRKGFSALKGR